MNKTERTFVATVLKFYQAHGRHDLPWRQTHDPYPILVSEIMLQQTQVARVIPKYETFLQLFPTVEALAGAPLATVLTAWQGLGYNRRAKLLHACAQSIVADYGGVWPRATATLRSLPGIGPYTASAVAAFAFGVPSPLIETNVRTVYLHHFFPDVAGVSDAQLLPIITATVDHNDPRSWYYALMDYGSYLKQNIGNTNVQSKHYTKQSTFKGSDRQIRGAIIRALSKAATGLTHMSLVSMLSEITGDPVRIQTQLQKLINENMVVKIRRRYQLPA